MRRFVATVTIALLVLAMSAGPAFAYSCVGSACGHDMSCPPKTSESCPVDGGQQMLHSTCNHTVRAQSRDATPTAPGHDVFVAAIHATVVPPAHLLAGLPQEVQATDARGAPHLSVVIRI